MLQQFEYYNIIYQSNQQQDNISQIQKFIKQKLSQVSALNQQKKAKTEEIREITSDIYATQNQLTLKQVLIINKEYEL